MLPHFSVFRKQNKLLLSQNKLLLSHFGVFRKQKELLLTQSEWQSLYATINKNPIPPKNPPSLRDAVRMIATLGGFLDRKGDGEPGVKTIWRGLRRLHDIAATWQLLHSVSPSHVYT